MRITDLLDARSILLDASHFPCGIAIPSPIPVVLSSSLAYTCFLYASLSLIFSLFTMRSTIWSSASLLLFGDASKRILLATRPEVEEVYKQLV